MVGGALVETLMTLMPKRPSQILRIERSSALGGETMHGEDLLLESRCEDRLSRPTVFPRRRLSCVLGTLGFCIFWLVGMLMVIFVPSPKRLETEMLPCSDSTMLFTRLNPRPVPGLNIFSCVKGVKR